jgi:hypothetical protein
MNRTTMFALVVSGALVMTAPYAFAEGDEDKKPEQPQALIVASADDSPYPEEPAPGSDLSPRTTVILAEGDEKPSQPAPELLAEGDEKPTQPAPELIAV